MGIKVSTQRLYRKQYRALFDMTTAHIGYIGKRTTVAIKKTTTTKKKKWRRAFMVHKGFTKEDFRWKFHSNEYFRWKSINVRKWNEIFVLHTKSSKCKWKPGFVRTFSVCCKSLSQNEMVFIHYSHWVNTKFHCSGWFSGKKKDSRGKRKYSGFTSKLGWFSGFCKRNDAQISSITWWSTPYDNVLHLSLANRTRSYLKKSSFSKVVSSHQANCHSWAAQLSRCKSSPWPTLQISSGH